MPIAIPAIGAVIIGLLALLLYYGSDQLGKVIISWTPDIHIPGIPGLRSLVRAIVETGVDLIQSIMYPVVHPVLKFIGGVGAWISHIIGALPTLALDTAGALHRLAFTWIPGKLAALRTWVLGHIAAAIGLVRTEIHVLRVNVWGKFVSVEHWVSHLVAASVAVVAHEVDQLRANVWAGIQDARDLARGLVNTLAASTAAEFAATRSWIGSRIAGVEADLAHGLAAVEGDIAAGVKAAEDYAAQSAAAAAGAIGAEITDATNAAAAALDGLITDDIPELLGVIATDFPDIRALLGEIDITGVGALAGTLATSMVMERVLARYLRECGLPNCRNLGGLGRFLQDLLGAASLAGLLAMLVEMLEDPEGAAHAAADVLQAPFDLARGLSRDLLGVG